jgi:hypothetical protein
MTNSHQPLSKAQTVHAMMMYLPAMQLFACVSLTELHSSMRMACQLAAHTQFAEAELPAWLLGYS